MIPRKEKKNKKAHKKKHTTRDRSHKGWSRKGWCNTREQEEGRSVGAGGGSKGRPRFWVSG